MILLILFCIGVVSLTFFWDLVSKSSMLLLLCRVKIGIDHQVVYINFLVLFQIQMRSEGWARLVRKYLVCYVL